MAPRAFLPGFGQLAGGSAEVASEGMFGARFRPDGPKWPFLGFGQLAGGSAEVASECLFGAIARSGVRRPVWNTFRGKDPFTSFRQAVRWLARSDL